MVMFAFRMVMIARVGDAVYGDEQDQFTCNTNQPGCNQVCYSRFSPISHLRFWSVMVIVTATPPIVFLAYATNIISRHARKKEEAEYTRVREKEERENEKYSRANPSSRYLKNLRKRAKRDNVTRDRLSRHQKNNADQMNNSRNSITSHPKQGDEDKLIPNGLNGLMDPPNYFDDNNIHGIPIYGNKNRYVAAVIPPKPQPVMSKYRPLHHPDIARAYWWQVVVRTCIEALFLWLQWYLFGFRVPEQYLCIAKPCPQTVECWVSRAMEKTIFLWFMFIVGSVSALLGLAEFWSLGLQRFKVAFGCSRQTRIQKQHKRKPSLSQLEHMDLALDMERFSICSLGNSGSSGSTISSV